MTTEEEKAKVREIDEAIRAGKMKCSWCDRVAVRGGTQHRFCQNHHNAAIAYEREYGWQNIPYEKFGKPIR